MALTVQAKTLWLLVSGAAVIVFLLLPIRLAPVVPESIDTLGVQARAQLIQRFEAPAKSLDAQADTLRRAIVARYGGTTPTQDSLLGELRERADELVQIMNHLRDPRHATFEERRQDVGKLLGRLLAEGNAFVHQVQQDYLK